MTLAPLDPQPLGRFGYCLWVVYQGDLPLGLVADSDAAADGGGGGGDGGNTK